MLVTRTTVKDPYGNIAPLGAKTFKPVGTGASMTGILFGIDGMQPINLPASANPIVIHFGSDAASFKQAFEASYPGLWDDQYLGFVGTLTGDCYYGAGGDTYQATGEADTVAVLSQLTPKAGYPILKAGFVCLGRVPEYWYQLQAGMLDDSDIDIAVAEEDSEDDARVESLSDALSGLTNLVKTQGYQLEAMRKLLMSGPNAPMLRPWRSIDLQPTHTTALPTLVAAYPTRLAYYSITNRSTSERFVKFYDQSGVLATSAVPVFTVPVAGLGKEWYSFPVGSRPTFSRGLRLRGCTLIADTDATAPTANDIVVNLLVEA